MSGRANDRRGYVWSGKCLVGEMSGRGCVRRGNVRRGSVRRGSVRRGCVRESYEQLLHVRNHGYFINN